MEKRRNRSERYQYVLLETTCSNDMMESFSNQESIYFRIDPFRYDERLEELNEELKREFWKIVDEHLTDRQKQVIKLYCQDKTQMEIAKILGVNQSSITKSINGNVDYKKSKKIYGGLKRRILKVCESNENIKRILKELRDLKEEKI